MATTCIWPVRGKIGAVIMYAENPEKTWNPDAGAYSHQEIDSMRDVLDYAMDNYEPTGGGDDPSRVMAYAADTHKTDIQYFVSGINCNTACARQQMRETKKRWNKENGIVAYHAYQSFAPGEVTPTTAHEIGVKLAQELWGDRFEVLVCTHVNTKSVHNHFVLNSVSMVDGKRYYDNKKSYARFRSVSDRLCREYSLSVIKEPKGRSKAYSEWQAEQSGAPTLRSIIRQDVDRAISESMTWRAFLLNLQKQGYTIKTNVKHLAIRPPGKERFVRLRSLGPEYEEEAIKQRILRQQQPTRRQPPTHTVRHMRCKSVFDFTLHKITWKSIRALYYHYMHILKQAEARTSEQEPAPFAVREDLRSYKDLCKEVQFLYAHKIDTRAQLLFHRDAALGELGALVAERKALNDEKRRTGTTPQRKAELTARTNAITARTKTLRKEIQLCGDISTRSVYLRERCAEARKQRQFERRAADEPYRGRSRPGSPDGYDHNDRDGQDRSGYYR
ncbi:relaxase/mobilization nuclease domain-containing protein [Christensenellaceae bacterium OttesenSCG-928-M15]|nr:relaxase/mobilization nuclease domain-containing protein [Christensenellaceae bacterium OttesenSCG-928-M15]